MLSPRMHDTTSVSNTTRSNGQSQNPSPVLAVGTLGQYGYPSLKVELPETNHWINLSPLLAPGTLGQHGYPSREVELLEKNGWIRRQTHHVSSNVQIYVDPKLAHRNNTQRSIRDLRTAFKVLMSKLDPSPEAWDGRKDATNPETLSNGEDDESLWYIFNTLQDPNPQVDLVKDGPSRKAMSYLLSDEDLSDYGLKTPLYPYQRRSAAMMVQREVQPARMLDPRLQACASPTGLEYYYNKEDGWITLQKDMYDEAVGGML